MSCACSKERDDDIRAITEWFRQTNPTWTPARCRARAVIEWCKGGRLVEGPRIMYVSFLSAEQVRERDHK